MSDNELTPQEIEQAFGGIRHTKDLVVPEESWGRFHFSNDAYSVSQILQLLTLMEPTFLRDQTEFGNHLFVAKINSAYVFGRGMVNIVGPTKDVDKVGLEIILKAKFGDSMDNQFGSIGEGVRWHEYFFKSDCAVFDTLDEELLPSLQKMGVQSNGSYAKVGDSTYFRLVGERLDLVGDTQTVLQVAEQVEKAFSTDIRAFDKLG